MLLTRGGTMKNLEAVSAFRGTGMAATHDEVYALTAYLLALNKLIGENETMNAQTLLKVKMPNRDGFIPRFPDKL
jgi:hypothetical protein